MTEQLSTKTSLLESASNVLLAQRQEVERIKLGQEFVYGVGELLWRFSPVPPTGYSSTWHYTYKEPGTHRIPLVVLETPEGDVSMYVEGEFKKINVPDNANPYDLMHSVKRERLTLHLERDGVSEDLRIIFDDKDNPDPALLPSNEQLKMGLFLLQKIKDGHGVKSLEPKDTLTLATHI